MIFIIAFKCLQFTLFIYFYYHSIIRKITLYFFIFIVLLLKHEIQSFIFVFNYLIFLLILLIITFLHSSKESGIFQNCSNEPFKFCTYNSILYNCSLYIKVPSLIENLSLSLMST